MRNMFKAVAVGVIALMIGGVSVSAATTSNSNNKQKIAKIKAENKKKISNAKKKQLKKNKQAKAAKANDKKLKKLNAQKRAEQKKIKTIAGKQRNVRVAVPNSNYPKTYTAKNTVLRTENLPSKLVDPKLASNPHLDAKAYYVYKKTNQDKSSRINGKLTPAQQKEMADYTITLLNSYLVANGKAPVKWSTQIQAQMTDLINKRQAANYGLFFTRKDLADKVFPANKGLNYKNELHDAMVTPSRTMLQLKVSVLNSLTHMIFVADYGQYAQPLKAHAGKQVGVAIEKTTGPEAGYYPYMLQIGLAQENGKVKLKNQKTTFASTYRKNVASAKEVRTLKASQKKVATLNKQIKARNATLNKNMKKKIKANNATFNKAKQQANRVMANKLRQL